MIKIIRNKWKVYKKNSEIPTTKGGIRQLFFRLFRPVVKTPKELKLLNQLYSNDVIGPLQKDEAFLLHGIIRTLQPKTIVEFGFHRGFSAFSMLSALNKSSLFVTFDTNPYSKNTFDKYFSQYPNTKFYLKGQEEFSIDDVNGRSIDLVFMDASHNLDLNKQTFNKIRSSLSKNAIILIHDTGLWKKEFIHKLPKAELEAIEIIELEGGIAHQLDERKFVNWLIDQEPTWNVVHFHSDNTLRHGLSMFSTSSAKLDV